jgi:hypothetical protein
MLVADRKIQLGFQEILLPQKKLGGKVTGEASVSCRAWVIRPAKSFGQTRSFWEARQKYFDGLTNTESAVFRLTQFRLS